MKGSLDVEGDNESWGHKVLLRKEKALGPQPTTLEALGPQGG